MKIWAEYKAGEALKQLKREQGKRNDKLSDSLSESSEYTQTIEDANIDERQARRWQEMSDLPSEKVQAHIEEKKAEGKEVVSS